MHKLKIGIVGCGAIGTSLAKAIKKDFSVQAKVCGLYDINPLKAKKLSRIAFKNTGLICSSLRQLTGRSELVIECASAACSWGLAKQVLSSGRNIMIMSVGGIAKYSSQLSVLARKHNAKVYIPSGAISGVDALKAASVQKIKQVVLTTTKNPFSFKGVKYVEEKGINLKAIKKDKVLFSGPAAAAVKYFPQNINVAAVLSLAGVGLDKTLVKIIASPAARKNIHEIRIISDAASIYTRTENIVHPQNPKTSYLAVLSAIAALKQILVPVRVGT